MHNITEHYQCVIFSRKEYGPPSVSGYIFFLNLISFNYSLSIESPYFRLDRFFPENIKAQMT